MQFNSDSYLHILAERMRQDGNSELAIAQSKYLKNLFPFFGLKSPERKRIIKDFIKDEGQVPFHELENTLKKAFVYQEREMHYYAQELIVKYKNKLVGTDLKLAKWLITHNSWWDTVDFLAVHIIGILCSKYKEVAAEVDSWIDHENMWLRRSAILYQLGYKDSTNEEKLFQFCAMRAYEKEFFIRKAIGWALREYSKINSKAVIEFVNEHQELSGLSKREALKHIK